MSRTFFACFRPEDLLPRDPELRKQYRFDMDYYDTLSSAAEVMRLRAWNLSRRTSAEPCKYVESVESMAAAAIDEVTCFKYQHLHETLKEKGDHIQRLLPPGDISGMRLCYLHWRGAYYTGVLQ